VNWPISRATSASSSGGEPPMICPAWLSMRARTAGSSSRSSSHIFFVCPADEFRIFKGRREVTRFNSQLSVESRDSSNSDRRKPQARIVCGCFERRIPQRELLFFVNFAPPGAENSRANAPGLESRFPSPGRGPGGGAPAARDGAA
jgi:hypothetical protein